MNSCKAPLFAINNMGTSTYDVLKGSCHKWTCERCGEGVAKSHYGRIVHGAKVISDMEENLYFLTITCKGGKLAREEAEQNYLKWTNAALTAFRQRAKKQGLNWYYVQVTEYQKREIPHSHLLTTFCPDDTTKGLRKRRNAEGRYEVEETLRSKWLQKAVVGAGLGIQYDISLVRDITAASTYVAKYMFKDTMFSTEYPEKWKRVRYSQSWPEKTFDKKDAIVLINLDDWQKLANQAVAVRPKDEEVFSICKTNLQGWDGVILKP